MKTITDIEEFLEAIEWNDLDINEKEGLTAALEGEPCDLGLFKVEPANGSEENIVLTDIAHGITILLTPKSKRALIKLIEHKFTNHEPLDVYVDFLRETLKDE